MTEQRHPGQEPAANTGFDTARNPSAPWPAYGAGQGQPAGGSAGEGGPGGGASGGPQSANGFSAVAADGQAVQPHTPFPGNTAGAGYGYGMPGPHMSQPQMVQPQMVQPQMVQPPMGHPPMGQPQMGHPQMFQPQMFHPQFHPQMPFPPMGMQTGHPTTGHPQMAGHPGMAGQGGGPRGPGMAELVEEIAGGGSGLAGLTRMLDLDDHDSWKGALVGAAAVLLLTNDSVQQALFKTGAKAKQAAQSGVDKVKQNLATASAPPGEATDE